MERIKKDILISELIYKSLTGTLRKDEEEVLEAWLGNAEHRKFYVELKNSARLYDGLLDMQAENEEMAWQRLRQQIAGSRRRRWIRWMSGVAAVLLVGVVAGWLLWQEEEGTTLPLAQQKVIHRDAPVTLHKATGDVLYLEDTVKSLILPRETMLVERIEPMTRQERAEEEPVYNVLRTSGNGTIEVTLYDGTRVWLNANSELEYPAYFSTTTREVILRGEGYFDVVKDARRPFVVHTPSARVEVLGTSFNVLAPGDGTCVTTLVDGRVVIADNEQNEMILSPGQQAELSPSGIWQVKEVDTRYYTAWREGLFAFKDCSLKEIVTTLSSWYRATFLFSDEELSSLCYTTMIRRYDRVEDVLLILEKVGDFRCEAKGDNIYVIKKK